MGRTLTITDDDLGATASVRIDDTPDGPRIARLHFDAADGGPGITGDAIRLMEALGLRLPAPTGPPADPPPPPQEKTRKPPAKRGRPAVKAAAKPKRPALPAARKEITPPPAAEVETPAAQDPPAAGLLDLADNAVDTDPEPPAGPEPSPPPPVPAPPPAPAPAQRHRRGGPPPAVPVLRAAFQRNNGNMTRIGEEFGVSSQTIGNWLRKARESGQQIRLDRA